jgi:hypothetical protein
VSTFGASDQGVARGVAALRLPVPPEDRFERIDEEAELEVAWVDLDEAVAMIFAARSPTLRRSAGCSPRPVPGTRFGDVAAGRLSRWRGAGVLSGEAGYGAGPSRV